MEVEGEKTRNLQQRRDVRIKSSTRMEKESNKSLNDIVLNSVNNLTKLISRSQHGKRKVSIDNRLKTEKSSQVSEQETVSIAVV